MGNYLKKVLTNTDIKERKNSSPMHFGVPQRICEGYAVAVINFVDLREFQSPIGSNIESEFNPHEKVTEPGHLGQSRNISPSSRWIPAGKGRQRVLAGCGRK